MVSLPRVEVLRLFEDRLVPPPLFEPRLAPPRVLAALDLSLPSLSDRPVVRDEEPFDDDCASRFRRARGRARLRPPPLLPEESAFLSVPSPREGLSPPSVLSDDVRDVRAFVSSDDRDDRLLAPEDVFSSLSARVAERSDPFDGDESRDFLASAMTASVEVRDRLRLRVRDEEGLARRVVRPLSDESLSAFCAAPLARVEVGAASGLDFEESRLLRPLDPRVEEDRPWAPRGLDRFEPDEDLRAFDRLSFDFDFDEPEPDREEGLDDFDEVRASHGVSSGRSNNFVSSSEVEKISTISSSTATRLRITLTRSTSLNSANVTAMPDSPARAVRPMRCRYIFSSSGQS